MEDMYLYRNSEKYKVLKFYREQDTTNPSMIDERLDNIKHQGPLGRDKYEFSTHHLCELVNPYLIS